MKKIILIAVIATALLTTIPGCQKECIKPSSHPAYSSGGKNPLDTATVY